MAEANLERRAESAKTRHADLMRQGFMRLTNCPAPKAAGDDAAWAKRCAEATRAHYARVGFD